MSQTYAERLVAGLLALGYVEERGSTGKYRTFGKPDRESKLFVGPSGALRSGSCASKSHSIGQPSRQTPAYQRVLSAGAVRAEADAFGPPVGSAA